MFYVVLQVSASNDLIAHKFSWSIVTVTRVFQVLVILLPPLSGYVAYRLMKSLQVSRAERFVTVPMEAVLHPKRYATPNGARNDVSDLPEEVPSEDAPAG
jgi:hypothetical protein